MYILSSFVKQTIPNYLAGLPIPDSIGGWFKLGVKDWLMLIPPTAVVAGASYYGYQAYMNYCSCFDKPMNPAIKKESPKVADFVDIEDISEKAVFCRCWRTKNWPYCDGSHGAHNKATGDNVGPLIVKHKEGK